MKTEWKITIAMIGTWIAYNYLPSPERANSIFGMILTGLAIVLMTNLIRLDKEENLPTSKS